MLLLLALERFKNCLCRPGPQVWRYINNRYPMPVTGYKKANIQYSQVEYSQNLSIVIKHT